MLADRDKPGRRPSMVWEGILGRSGSTQSAVITGYWRGGLILANVSAANFPELIVQVKGMELGYTVRRNSSNQLAGLEIWFENLTFNGAAMASLVMRPKHSDNYDAFYALADHLVSRIPVAEPLGTPAATVEQIIDEWAQFWAKTRGTFRREQLLGLLGELIAIDRVLDLSDVDYTIWEGPLGAPKDFRWIHDAMEVKVLGTRTGPVVHTISSVDQLQPPHDGKLYVLSIRVTFGAHGNEALDDLVQRVKGLPLFQNADAKHHFDGALNQCGFDHDIPLEYSRFDLLDIEIYEIRDDFPRLTKSEMPSDSRILDITYKVDFSGAGEFLLEKNSQKLKLR